MILHEPQQLIDTVKPVHHIWMGIETSTIIFEQFAHKIAYQFYLKQMLNDILHSPLKSISILVVIIHSNNCSSLVITEKRLNPRDCENLVFVIVSQTLKKIRKPMS